RARDRRPDQPGRLVQRGAVVGDAAAQALDADGEPDCEQEDDGGVAEGEEEADAERALPVAHQLARRVVDRADVVGVERVAHAERVRRDADTDSEDSRAELQMLWSDEAEQQAEADDMQREDDERQYPRAPPLGRRERAAKPRPPRDWK